MYSAASQSVTCLGSSSHVAGVKELLTQHHMHARSTTTKDGQPAHISQMLRQQHSYWLYVVVKLHSFVWLQLAAEMHQLHAQQGGDMAGLPILVPNLTAQMMASKK